MTRSTHWNSVYADKDPTRVSWFQDRPDMSLDLIARAHISRDAAVIDIGAGAGTLVDHLVAAGFSDVTALDLSAKALDTLKARLGDKAVSVETVVADVTAWTPPRQYDLWHDRAAFHFLTDEADRAAYVARMEQALRPGATAIIATFAEDGPETCSGLPVCRYSPAKLAAALGPAFDLVGSHRDRHVTPGGATQQFQYAQFTRL